MMQLRLQVTYYVVVSFVGKTAACFAAGGVGVVGSAMDYINSQISTGRPWPRLLNSAEMLNYLCLGLLFFEDQHCKMWCVKRNTLLTLLLFFKDRSTSTFF
jgi:hypothetical protein